MFKQIRDDFREINEYISQLITTVTSTIKMRLLIYMADLKQKTYNKRFFISIIETPRGDRLRVFDNEAFNYFKRKKWLPKNMTTLELEKKCLYATPLRKNNNVSNEDRKKATKKYINYIKSIRMISNVKGRIKRTTA